jgi:23S rRNA pseudouridine1911/1915/1917 synthase
MLQANSTAGEAGSPPWVRGPEAKPVTTSSRIADAVNRRVFVIEPPLGGHRLDHAVAGLLGVSNKEAARLVSEDRVRVEGRRAAKGDRVTVGQSVEVIQPAAAIAPYPELPVAPVLTHDRFYVVAKPPRKPTLPQRPGEPGTFAGALVAFDPSLAGVGGELEAGLVNRLDNGTSGLLLVARDNDAWTTLRGLFDAHGVEKTYLALAEWRGTKPVVGDTRLCGVAIAHHAGDPARMVAVGGDGSDTAGGYRGDPQPAETTFEVVAVAGPNVLIRAQTHTGRRHQVRVHAREAGFPLIGDFLYGVSEPGGFHLHAGGLAFTAFGNEHRAVVAPPPSFVRAAGLRDLTV